MARRTALGEIAFRGMGNNLDSLMSKTLTESFRAFICHGPGHLFVKAPARGDLLQAILNIQGSMEVMAKLYQLKMNGWQSLLEKRITMSLKRN
jgi:hypothetical protein